MVSRCGIPVISLLVDKIVISFITGGTNFFQPDIQSGTRTGHEIQRAGAAR
jgi:hypothetical protein